MSEIVEQRKEYRVFKLTSTNTDYFYVDYTTSKSYMSVILQGLITRYKQTGNTPSKYKDYFYIISKTGLRLEELKRFEDDKEMDIYKRGFYDDDKCINNKKPDDYVYVPTGITCVKEKVDKQKYLKSYYEKNKDKYKERYISKRETILQKMKDTYVSKKKVKEV